MKKIIGIILIIISNTVIANSLLEFPFITISGEAEIEVAPDTATISFTLFEFNKNSDDAMKIISTRGKTIVNLAEKYNITKEQIVSFGLDKSIRRAKDSNNNNLEIIGYEISQRFKIELSDINVYSSFTDALISMANVTAIQSIFDVNNRKDILRNLVKSAGEDALVKAKDLADSQGVTVTSVYAINQDTNFGTFFATFGLSGNKHLYAYKSRSEAYNMFIPKTIKINKTVNVIYKIKP